MQRRWHLNGRGILFIAFAFTVMADPVSSIAYAIESALRKLDGDLGDLFLTMLLVGATITVIAATYHQLIRRFPEGGGGARSVGTAFGDAWAFVPLGALLVDFVITVAISCAAGASAIIAYVPGLEPERVLLALALTGLVAGGISFGHRGRVAFSAATLLFIALAAIVIVAGAVGPAQAPVHAKQAAPVVADASLIPALFAMPLAMALATGIEAPSDAIAQLGQLDRTDPSAVRAVDDLADRRDRRRADHGHHDPCDRARRWPAAGGLDAVGGGRPHERRRWHPVRRLPGCERAAAPGCRRLVLPCRLGPAQGACPRRHPARR